MIHGLEERVVSHVRPKMPGRDIIYVSQMFRLVTPHNL